MNANTSMKFSDSDIENYYDATRSHYNYFWKLKQNRSLHYGYWDNTTRNFSGALVRINAVMANHVGMENGMKVLDTGCGEGGSVCWVASNFDVEVTGITLSKKQMNSGNAYLKQRNVLKAKIEVQNYCHTTFKDASFDVVWAIESVCHAQDKKEYLSEMFRILKPGGKIIMADFFIAKELNASEKTSIDNWAHAWAVPGFESVENFMQISKEVGFMEAAELNISRHVEKSVKRLYRMFCLGVLGSISYNLLFPKTNAAAKRNVYSAYWQYVTFKRKLWNYQIVTIRK